MARAEPIQSWIKHCADGASVQSPECSRGPKKIKTWRCLTKRAPSPDHHMAPRNRRSDPKPITSNFFRETNETQPYPNARKSEWVGKQKFKCSISLSFYACKILQNTGEGVQQHWTAPAGPVHGQLRTWRARSRLSRPDDS
jgi:hypothetical protein